MIERWRLKWADTNDYEKCPHFGQDMERGRRMIQGMSEICIDCVHQEVCKYECYCPSEHCNDYAVADDFIPQGEWIIVKDERYGDNVKCPFCGKELAGTDLNFCCKCGAKLTGSEKMNGGAE